MKVIFSFKSEKVDSLACITRLYLFVYVFSFLLKLTPPSGCVGGTGQYLAIGDVLKLGLCPLQQVGLVLSRLQANDLYFWGQLLLVDNLHASVTREVLLHGEDFF